MKTVVEGNPSFSHVHIDLEPGETVTAESGAMQSMSASLEMKAMSNGGFFSALLKKVFGGETFFVNEFRNGGTLPLRLTIAQNVPGEIRELHLSGDQEICLQKGAWLASAGDISFKPVWAGFVSWFTGEGLIKLKAYGTGTLWFGAYGGIIERDVQGDLKVDDGHLVAYSPSLTLKVALAGGLLASITSGEGFVIKIAGQGKVYIQTRSIKGLASWLNPKFR